MKLTEKKTKTKTNKYNEKQIYKLNENDVNVLGIGWYKFTRIEHINIFRLSGMSYFMMGEVFFGVLYSLLGVLGRETGVVLGAILTFFGVAIRLGDGDDFGVADALVLQLINHIKIVFSFEIKFFNRLYLTYLLAG